MLHQDDIADTAERIPGIYLCSFWPLSFAFVLQAEGSFHLCSCFFCVFTHAAYPTRVI